MRIRSLTLIGSTLGVLRSDWVDATLRSWPDHEFPPILTTTVEHILDDETILDGTRVAWIILNKKDNPRLGELVGLLQQLHLSAVLTIDGQTQPIGTSFEDGIVMAPADADPGSLCAILRTLWNQAGIVLSLKTEMRMLQVHQDGLCDQIGKIDEELRLASQIQREFLPHKLPGCDHVELRVLFRPAGYVSGDLYDAVRLDENHIGFFVADAAGHGVPAALMTMYLKRSLHGIDEDPSAPGGYRLVPPGEALARLNNDMFRHRTGKTRFVTACYGVLNCKTLEVTVARAGHPFPLLLRADGTVEELQPDGMLLGMFPDSQYEQETTQLTPGDRLLIYSDGFQTAFPQLGNGDDAEASTANMQYLEEFKDLASGSLAQAISQLEAKLDQQIGSLNQRDDLTVLCISAMQQEKVTGKPASQTPTRRRIAG